MEPEESAAEEGRGARDAWALTTYFAEGLPYSLVHQIAPVLFTALGASLEAQGLTSLYGLAWNAKFTWSPLVDRFGTTRRWVVATEALLALAIASVVIPASGGDLALVARLLVVVSVLAATHDVAVDGFYLRALAPRAQASWSGPRVAAYRVALLAGKGGLVALAGLVSWRASLLVAAGFFAIAAVGHGLLLPREPARRADEASLPIADAFVSFFTRPKALVALAFILVYRAGDALLFAMSPGFFKSLGFSTTQQGAYAGFVGTAASIGGSLLGGAIVARRGLAKTLAPIALLQSLALPLYALVALARPSVVWIVTAIVVEQIAAGIGSAALVVFLMRRASGKYKASHFAIASALMSVATTVAGSSSGYLAAAVGFPAFFAIAFVASLPGVVLARFAPTD